MKGLGGVAVGVAVAVIGPGGWAGIGATFLMVLGILFLTGREH